MILQYLIQEFEHEVNSTRKLLQAIPAKDLGFKPSETSWNMGELAQHIATVYYWYVGTLTQNIYDLSKDNMEREKPMISKLPWHFLKRTWKKPETH